MWLLSQVADQFAENHIPTVDPAGMWPFVLFEIIFSLLSLIYFPFLIWMMVHCYRNEPDRMFWFWIMIIAQGLGPIAYFVLRYLPSKEFPAPAFFRKWTRGRELARLETAAEQIGNPHQFVQWGDALREVGQLDRAREAYDRALRKDPRNLQALWGSAQVAVAQKRPDDTRSLTQRVLDQDPQYKFGDVSLAHGRALNELGQTEAARLHFEQHVRRWRHPEALYLLAKLCVSQGDPQTGRQHLVGLIQDINGSPAAISRKFGRWKSLARQLLRKLPA